MQQINKREGQCSGHKLINTNFAGWIVETNIVFTEERFAQGECVLDSCAVFYLELERAGQAAGSCDRLIDKQAVIQANACGGTEHDGMHALHQQAVKNCLGVLVSAKGQ